MTLPLARTRQQRAAWIAVFTFGALAAVAFAGALHFDLDASLANAWFDAFYPQYQYGWSGDLGRIAELGLAFSAACLIFGAPLCRSLRAIAQWVSRGE